MTIYELAIPLLTFLAVLSFGGAWLALRAARRQPIDVRLNEFDSMYAVAAEPSSSSPMMNILQSIGRLFSPKNPTTTLQQDLARAGYHGSVAVPIYLGTKITLFLLGVLVGLLVISIFELTLPMRIFIVVGIAALMSFLPNLYVARRRRKRREEIRQVLPDAIDLLEICVSSGMGLEMAWNAVADEVRQVSSVLADEMALTNLESHLGAPNAEAMKHMAERTQVQEVASLTAALIQSERFGTSVADALTIFAGAMREERSQRAQEAAEQLAVKLIFPMVLFIFPAIVIVMAGPAMIRLANAIGH